MSAPRAITIAILAMGGEGGGVLADWIVDLAEHGGYVAQSTSVPGVAQRTGSTIYYVEIFPDIGKEPVLALMPVPGEVDVVIASELMEAGRAIQRGLVTSTRTTLIASTHRVYSMTERTASGDGRVDSAKLLDACRSAARLLRHADFARIAREHSSVISAPLFGALAATGALPFHREQFQEAIRRSGVGVDSSLAAFAAGSSAQPDKPGMRADPTADSVIRAGVARLKDYQDERYSAEYIDLLAPVRKADPGGALLRETARYLALWMSYEDAIRVAALKISPERLDRVRREARLGEGELLQVFEYLHPRAEEIADILPPWAMRSAWTRRFVGALMGRGKVLETTSLSGFLQLRLIASLRGWRRSSLRFQREHGKIRAWLAAIVSSAVRDYEFALELAQCPRVLKGYGDTHSQGARKFDSLMESAARLQEEPGGAERLKALREAALVDA